MNDNLNLWTKYDKRQDEISIDYIQTRVSRDRNRGVTSL